MALQDARADDRLTAATDDLARSRELRRQLLGQPLVVVVEESDELTTRRLDADVARCGGTLAAAGGHRACSGAARPGRYSSASNTTIGSTAQSTWASTLCNAVASEGLPVLGMTTLTARWGASWPIAAS